MPLRVSISLSYSSSRHPEFVQFTPYFYLILRLYCECFAVYKGKFWLKLMIIEEMKILDESHNQLLFLSREPCRRDLVLSKSTVMTKLAIFKPSVPRQDKFCLVPKYWKQDLSRRPKHPLLWSLKSEPLKTTIVVGDKIFYYPASHSYIKEN